jgi:membrane protease YdiL (CAAX protease family)
MSMKILPLVRLLRTETTVQVACQLPAASSGLSGSVAPAWHTRLLLVWLLGVPLLGLTLEPSFAEVGSVWELYAPSVLLSLVLAAFVTRIGLSDSILRELVGKTWRSSAEVVVDAIWGFGFAALVITADRAIVTVLGSPESAASHALMPRSAAQTACWLLVALSVGISEELVYRGYLRKQLAALSGSSVAGMVLQALLFAIAHAEQGGSSVARFAVYALGFGWLASKRGSLLPAMLAHVGLDVYAGLAG